MQYGSLVHVTGHSYLSQEDDIFHNVEMSSTAPGSIPCPHFNPLSSTPGLCHRLHSMAITLTDVPGDLDALLVVVHSRSRGRPRGCRL